MGGSLIGGGGGGVVAGSYPIKGELDASLASNLPATPSDGDTYRISVAGTFELDASIFPASYAFTIGDYVSWDATNSKWQARESGDDSLKVANDLSEVNAGTARTNLAVDSATETTSKAIKYSIALG